MLDTLGVDIAVIQECARPEFESPTCLWFGDNPNRGIAIQTSGSYSLKALPVLPDVPKYIIPVSVFGPINFTLLAVWTKSKQPYWYVAAAVQAVEMYHDVILSSTTVIIGDFNSNAIWDKNHSRDFNHSALVKQLSDLGLVSAYHYTRNELHGQETDHTFYLYRKKDRPYHIDYCFLPRLWADKIMSVEISPYELWSQYSDHSPLLVEIRDDVIRG